MQTSTFTESQTHTHNYSMTLRNIKAYQDNAGNISWNVKKTNLTRPRRRSNDEDHNVTKPPRVGNAIWEIKWRSFPIRLTGLAHKSIFLESKTLPSLQVNLDPLLNARRHILFWKISFSSHHHQRSEMKNDFCLQARVKPPTRIKTRRGKKHQVKLRSDVQVIFWLKFKITSTFNMLQGMLWTSKLILFGSRRWKER